MRATQLMRSAEESAALPAWIACTQSSPGSAPCRACRSRGRRRWPPPGRDQDRARPPSTRTGRTAMPGPLRRLRCEAAHVAGLVEAYFARLRQPKLQPGTGALNAGLGPAQRNAQSIGEDLLRRAVDVAKSEREPVFRGEFGQRSGQTLAQFFHRSALVVGRHGELIHLGQRHLFARCPHAVGQRVARHLEERGARYPPCRTGAPGAMP